MLNVSAPQQIKKELDAVKAENESLKTLIKQLAEKDQARDARLIAIEKELAPSGGSGVQTVSLGAGTPEDKQENAFTYAIASSPEMPERTLYWTEPQPSSLASDGSNPVSYYLADEAKILNIYVPVGGSTQQYFNLGLQ